MPLYEYECTKCKRRFERIEKVNGPHLRKCPQCSARVERLMTPPAIQFKGSGWYVTDYAGKGSSSNSDSGKKEAPAKDTAAKESPKESKKESSSGKDKS